jgi:hypothetical protein
MPVGQRSVPLGRRSVPPVRHSAPPERHSVQPEQHSAQPEQHSGSDCCCRAVRAAAAAYLRPRGAAWPQRAHLLATAARPARRPAAPGVSAERVRQPPAQLVLAEPVRQRLALVVLAEQVRQQELASAEPVQQSGAQAVSAQQVAALPPEGRDAAVVRLPAADAVAAALGVGAVLQPEARRALVAQVRGAAAAMRAWEAPGALALPLAVLSALAFRPDRLRSAPAPQPAVRFGRATTGLRIASP